MIVILAKSLIFIKLHLLVIIIANLVHKYNKYKSKILKIAKFIFYLSCTFLIFFNALQV